MKKIAIILVSCIMGIGILLTGCSGKQQNSKNEEVEKEENTTQVAENDLFTQDDNEDKEELSFEDVNIIENELINRDDDSYTEIISDFRITNKGENNIDYFSADFAYFDGGGKQICTDGRYHDCQIESGKSAIVTTYSRLDGKDKSLISDIELISYVYRIGDKEYSVNLQTKEVSKSDSYYATSNVDFDSANVLQFNINLVGVNLINSFEADVQIQNNGQNPIKYCSYRMEYYDAEGNSLSGDGRYSDTLLNPGNYNQSKSFCDEKQSGNVADCSVYSYDYDLVDVDANGFNHYEINTQTKTAIGSKKE